VIRNPFASPRYYKAPRLSRIVAGIVVGWLAIVAGYLALMLAGV
jgi:hypothetical protein